MSQPKKDILEQWFLIRLIIYNTTYYITIKKSVIPLDFFGQRSF